MSAEQVQRAIVSRELERLLCPDCGGRGRYFPEWYIGPINEPVECERCHGTGKVQLPKEPAK